MTDYAYQLLTQSSDHAILKMKCLSKFGKKYGLIVVHFMKEKDADSIFAQDLLKVGGPFLLFQANSNK